MTTEETYRARSESRAQQQLQTDVAKFLLTSVGCLHLFRDLSWVTNPITLDRAISVAEISQHADFDPFPMQLEFQYRKSSRPEHGIAKLLGEFESSFVDRFRNQDGAVGVIMPWHGEIVVLHNRPRLTQQRPIDRLKIDEDCNLALHWFERLIGKLAERCRCEMTDEDTVIELEEGEWRPKDWEDYPRAVFK